MFEHLWKNLDRLVACVVQNQADMAIAIIESGAFDEGLLTDLKCCENPLPLYKLSMCNDILLSEADWGECFRPVVERNREGCRRLLEFWKHGCGYPVDEPMDFGSYQYECAHFKDWDLEDLLDGTVDELVALGYDRNEVELCYAVLTYKAELIEKHIGLRTNPDVFISGELPAGEGKRDDYESYNALDACSNYYDDALFLYPSASFWEAEDIMPIRVRDVHLLLEAAAYCDLENRLKPIAELYSEG